MPPLPPSEDQEVNRGVRSHASAPASAFVDVLPLDQDWVYEPRIVQSSLHADVVDIAALIKTVGCPGLLLLS